MASITLQQKQALISEISPSVDTLCLKDHKEAVSNRCCRGCFQGLSYRPRQASNNGNEGLLMHQQEETKKDGWLVEKVKKLKEIAEVLAEPKWKNYIGKLRNNKKKTRMQYKYDLRSYALNFDDGIDREVDAEYPDFLARYIAPVGIRKGESTYGSTEINIQNPVLADLFIVLVMQEIKGKDSGTPTYQIQVVRIQASPMQPTKWFGFRPLLLPKKKYVKEVDNPREISDTPCLIRAVQ
ncbi:unnamed protein product [Dovyalis caffra]|uniref:Uncharacterized protein n=1 Tax=Dovyalis caffra TaxID=77055 RepID=A0AAV1SLG0_9ROSI|nr:unnamed protein product [Dovyalis caffra]